MKTIPWATSHIVNDELSYEADAKYVEASQGNSNFSESTICKNHNIL